MMRVSRAGFSLIELVVVVAIFAILAGLLLSGVQAVRTAASRAQCQGNLRQLALAAEVYEGNHGRYPRGCVPESSVEVMRMSSWRLRIMPELSQSAVWEKAQASYEQHPMFHTPPHDAQRTLVWPFFICPSDSRGLSAWKFYGIVYGLSHYLGVSGTDSASETGILGAMRAVAKVEIRDGSSQTLIIGERPPSADLRFGWWYAGYGVGGSGELDSHLPVTSSTSPAYATYKSCVGRTHAFGPGRIDDPCSALHFWSLHGPGANFAFADGSVRFLKFTASTILPALATRAGGESAELP